MLIAGRRCRVSISSDVAMPAAWNGLFSAWENPSMAQDDPDIDLRLKPVMNLRPTDKVSANLEDGAICDRRWRAAITIPGICGTMWFADGRLSGDLEVDQADSFGVMASVRIAMALHVETSGGLLLHASGVWKDNRVWIFSGTSGAGKTTIATELNAGGSDFSEDEVVLEFTESGVLLAHATPFGDERLEFPCPRIGEVAAIVFIRQAGGHRVDEMSGLDAVAALVRESRWFERDVAATGGVLETIDRIIRGGYLCRMDFKRDSGFWPLLEQRFSTAMKH